MQKDLNQWREKLARIEKTEAYTKKIPPAVAVSDSIIDYENELVVFSFKEYKHNHCQIYKLGKKESKKLTNELTKISTTSRKHLLYRDTSGINCKPIENSDGYSIFFEGLPKDAQVLEISFTGAGRIFGYLSRNIFNVVAIEKKHL